MNFDNQSIRTSRDCRERKRHHKFGDATCVAWIDDDREMAFTLYHRNCRDVESVSCRSLESPDAPLTYNDLIVPMRHDVLRGHEQLGYRCRESALEENGPLHVSELREQSKVLHVARANLEHVRMLGDEIHMPRIQHFSHNRNSNLASNLR